MCNLLYLTYGGRKYCDEAVFSILSALRFEPAESLGFRILVYTDSPESFADLPVVVEPVDGSRLRDWAGVDQYIHRRKIMVLADAMHKYPGPTCLLDTDTFFRASPGQLFARIQPGHSLMDLMEGPVSEPIDRALKETALGPAACSAGNKAFSMWNSGVVGLHHADASLLDDVITVNDRLYGRSREFNVEQFAFGCCLDQRTTLQEARDVVYHYCHPALKASFQRSFADFRLRCGNLSYQDRAACCYEFRPRWDSLNEAKIRFKLCLRALGLFRRPIRFELS